ncbi:hypothetical protein PFICI_04629 [Pestalotiopsis fici W106-1]|uniref:AB hydrolase-1 domain-containing protein n=1 Tax=Pestalotiopsis fici (strain W106-1 / CGMCC3.15140) TaxID=1229662 RepID=W3X9H8_PESFW|nr:uncharacterized protein PFICI_04629 [Pestalotiopsis fici W106-1]ETS82753.1 hypothetical protein PFICI_04629 [Pestalotiopsis fici W106-1]
MATERPVIVLIHGAWHPPHYYRKTIDLLRKQGYVVLAPPLPTTGLDDSVAGKTYVDDVKRVHEALLPHLDAGRQAVILCHSQGGIAGSACVEGQTVEDRKTRGLDGGIKAVVYLAAFALSNHGASLMGDIGGKCAPFFSPDPEDPPFHKLNEKAANTFYNCLQPEEARQSLVDGLVYQSKASQHAGAHFVATDVTVPKTYIVCSEDQAIPREAQIHMAQATGCEIVEITSDHSPFLQDDKNQEIVDVVFRVASK